MQGQCNLPAAAIVLLMLAYSALAAPRDYPYAESPPRTILTTDAQAFLSSIQNGLMQELPAENKPTKQKDQHSMLQKYLPLHHSHPHSQAVMPPNIQSLTTAPPMSRKQGLTCYQSIYILAFTSGESDSQTDDSAYVMLTLSNNQDKTLQLYDRSGNDYAKNKGDIWKIPLPDFGFSKNCISRSDITGVTLLPGENDGWNIESIVTFLKAGNTYLQLTQDFNVFRWIDGNGGQRESSFSLTLI